MNDAYYHLLLADQALRENAIPEGEIYEIVNDALVWIETYYPEDAKV